jgi:hypothetical protein
LLLFADGRGASIARNREAVFRAGMAGFVAAVVARALATVLEENRREA